MKNTLHDNLYGAEFFDPNRQESDEEGDLYKPVADDSVLVPDRSLRPFDDTFHAITENSNDGPTETTKVAIKPKPKNVDCIHCKAAAVNNFQYMVGVDPHMQTAVEGSPFSKARNELHAGAVPSEDTMVRQDSRLMEKFVKSFAFGRVIVPTMNESSPNNNAFFGSRQEMMEIDFEKPYHELPIPYTEACTSEEDLDYDSLEWADIWLSFQSSSLFTNAVTGIRTMVFAVFPSFVLAQHPKTSHFFTAGQLLPTIAASLNAEHVGGQIQMTIMILQVAVYLCAWGTFVQACNLESNEVAWWFTAFFIPFLIGLFGDIPPKRMMMTFGLMMMEFSAHMTTSMMFPINFAMDLVLASLFALLAAFLPFPVFAFRLANEEMGKMHSLYAAAVGNAVKSFWAPVLLDAEVARNQIPWSKMRDAKDRLQTLMKSIPYEPFECGLKNIFRELRLDHLSKIRWCLYSLSAAAALDNELRQMSLLTPLSEELRETQRRIHDRGLKLSGEAMEILVAIGAAIYPEEIRAIDFGPLAEQITMMEDLINAERDRTLLSKKFSMRETNNLLRMFAFHTTLLTLGNELLSIESWAVNYDKTKYPTVWERLWNFFVKDYWTGFWEELPNRMFLSTPRDVRIVKDAIRYSLGLLVAVAFTHGTANKSLSAYYFGMSILARLAQQTASETIQIGIMRICGLAFGAAFAHFIVTITNSLWYTVLLVVVFGFFCVFISRNPVYGQVGQYAVIVMIGTIPQTRKSPEYMLNRITANIFAFTCYLIVCLSVFPVDPIRVVRNYRTKVVKTANELSQLLVALGCCPITRSADEGKYLIAEAEKVLNVQRGNLLQALMWNSKAASEPTVRGDWYPDKAVANLFTRFAEMSSLQEGLLTCLTSLHRTRVVEPSILVYGIFEMIRPFLVDVAKLMERYFQLVINASEKPTEWSLENTITQLWRGELSVISLRKVTGKIQQNFIMALMPKSGLKRAHGDEYVRSDQMEAALLRESFELINKSMDGSFSNLMASFHKAMTKFPASREDLCVFETLVVNYIVLMSAMKHSLEPLIEIHDFELSRVVPS